MVKNRTREKQNFGSIEQLPSGKFRARYTEDDGTRYKAPTTFYTYGDAAAWLRHEEKLVEFGEWTPPAQREKKARPLTVGEWIEQWLELRKNDLAESTWHGYREQLDRRILQVTGKASRLREIPLAQLTKADVISWWDAVTGDFGYQNYNHQAFRRLKTALNWAVDRDLIPANPASGITVITRPLVKRKKLPSLEVLNAVYDHTPEQYKPVIMLTLFHGLRIGEALALQRRDISDDGEHMAVSVHASLWRKPGVGMMYKDTPKTDAGVRVVPVFPRFVPMLRHHVQMRVGDRSDAFITTTATGGSV